MFKKVLVANRGEIAVRILRACRELGIQTVAVYSEADRIALHVRYADEAYLLGPAPSRESYLRADKIIDIARQCHADAIHPGYGFLAERESFAAACADAGIAFIGPRASAIAAMGDKMKARETVVAAGVPVVPGTEGARSMSDEELLREAPRVGFPLLIKASAGGGGKGMREVRSAEEMPSLLSAARREAEAAFGDGNVYLEKLLEGARHIEVQILADQFGNVIHLGERDCSLQRRHQKLIEESPSPFVDDELRATMGAVAVKAAKSVEYLNAGTIEFLVDKDKNFYFLEMNTRLQVEHPVTEAVTGLDLVRLQLEVAAGRPLPLAQEDVARRGHAIECRLYAEDPQRDDLPSPGRVLHISEPEGPGIRVDSGLDAGSEITVHYDPLLSKIVTWGQGREEAIERMRDALRRTVVLGVVTNLARLRAVVEHAAFAAGELHTGFIEEHLSELTPSPCPPPEAIAAVVAALGLARDGGARVRRAAPDPWADLGPWRLGEER
jgi:acetyl-CoA carboxylase biotin carboxylase subunit